MISLSIKKISKFCNGKLNDKAKEIEETHIAGVSIDTRTIETNNMFAPFIGENVDGHNFILNAIESGAVVSLSEKENIDAPLIIVDDVEKALGDIAREYLKLLDVKVIAITGSNGKTTTKDMVECVLRPHFKVQKTIGNYNNEIGLPLTVFNTKTDTDILILEMGMDSLGDIHYLSSVANPDIAVLTNVGESHIEKLGSRENIAKAKYEIVDDLKKDGLFIYSNDYDELKKLVNKNTSYEQVTVGMTHDNDLIVEDIKENQSGVTFTLQGETYNIPSLGKHNAVNASFAIAVSESFNIDKKSVKESLQRLTITNMRMEQHVDDTGALIINDAYNASPSSMKSAIDTVRHLNYKKKILVLGDILELGSYSEVLHREVGEYINEDNNFTHIFTYGDAAKAINSTVLSDNTNHFNNIKELKEKIDNLKDEDTVILLKASRGMKLERLISE